jgi:hypothetical protein
MKPKTENFNRGDLFKLFLIVAFPLHVWTILMALRDVGWVAEGRTFGGAVGFSAYVLVLTLIESLFIFGLILLLGLLVSKQWSKDQRLVTLGLIAMILAGWSIIEQIILVLLYDRMVSGLSRFTILGTTPLVGFILLGVIVLVSFAFPIYQVLRSTRVAQSLANIFDRLSLLSGFYLFFDAIAIVILIVRNV